MAKNQVFIENICLKGYKRSQELKYLYLLNHYILLRNMQPEEQHKFSSVLRHIRLPEKRHLYESQKLFPLPENQEQYDLVHANVKEKTKELIEAAEKDFIVFVNPKEYEFTFPESKFPDVPKGERNTITYQQKNIVEDEDTFKDRLSEEQVAQIAQKGEFEVKSSIENVKIPYVWKINDIIFRGRKNIVNLWENGLSGIYQFLTKGFELVVYDIPKEAIKIFALPKKLFSLIFGRKKWSAIYTPNYDREVQKDFWQDIMKNELEDERNYLGSQFWQYLYVPYEARIYESIKEKDSEKYKILCEKQEKQRKEYENKVQKMTAKKNQLIEVQDKFDKNWLKIRKRILQKVSAEDEEEQIKSFSGDDEDDPLKKASAVKENKTLEKFQKQKQALYIAHLKENLPKLQISNKIIQALVLLIHLVSLFDAKVQLKNEKLREVKEKIREKIKKKHTIRSRVWNFTQKKVKEEYDPIQKKVEEDFKNQFLEDPVLVEKIPERFVNVYKKYVNFQFKYNALVEQKKKVEKPLYIPSRVFRTTYMLLPPYEVINSSGYYYAKKQKEMSIDTSKDFWKFRLYAMRMKSWTINCLVTLIALAWVGPFGLRCIYGIEEFKYDEYADSSTGQKRYQRRKPWIRVFLTVLDGIRKSREEFEALPDRGLFGKNISRWFNYAECYIFRFLMVGVIGVIIIYPILIVTLSTLCFVLIVTFWAWVPIIMVVCYLFNILVFQFQSSYIPRGVVIRSVPLLSLAFFLIGIILRSLFYLIFGLVISPFLSAMYFIFLVIQRLFRTFTDKVMLCIIAKLGRTPSKNTAIARKISGPGMSRTYFMSIAEEDVYVLTQCKLESIFFEKFVQKTTEKINEFTKPYQQTVEYILNPFGHHGPMFNHQRRGYVLENKNQLVSNFNSQASHYRNRYPRFPNRVRFTREEIDNYFENCIKIVDNFVQKQQIKDWIFEDFHILEGDYDELTRMIWMQIFSCGEEIFEPLEKIDQRFKLEDVSISTNSSKMRKKVGSVMKALEGEVILNKDRVRFSPAKRHLLTKDYKISAIQTLCNLHGYNSQTTITINLNDPKTLLVPHMNLEELKKHDKYQKETTEQSYDNIIRE